MCFGGPAIVTTKSVVGPCRNGFGVEALRRRSRGHASLQRFAQ
jgi:hypothetical protein